MVFYMMADDSSADSFHGEGPGQNLVNLAENLNEPDLCRVLGTDVVSLIRAIVEPQQLMARLRQVAGIVLRDRAIDLLASSDIREICFSSMSVLKLDELCRRLGLPHGDSLHNDDVYHDAARWQRFLEFFGVDGRAAAPFAMGPSREGVHADFELFPHQQRLADAVCHAIRGGHGRVVLHMPTGAGKTRTAMHIVSRVLSGSEAATVVWLAASRELLDQSADAFQQAWKRLGNRKIDLLRFWGDYEADFSDCSDCFIVAGLQKMHALKVRDPLSVLRLGKSVSLVVVDEAHQAIAPSYREVINTIADTGVNNAVVGLTATPGRTWSDVTADEQLADFFGGRKAMLEVEGWENPVSFLMSEGYLARPTFRRLEIRASPEVKQQVRRSRVAQDYDDALLESLAEQVDRNRCIVDEISHLIEDGHRRILLFATSVRHAESIAAVLTALGIDGRFVTAKTNPTARTQVIRAFRSGLRHPMVLCNFGVLTTGFDAPNTSAVVIARPTKSLVLFSQMVGRATRGVRAGGNKDCAISTVVDIDLPGFGDVADAFTNWEDVWHESR